MPRLVRHALVSLRDLFAAAGPFVLLILLLLALAYWALDPTPPKRLVLLTGPEQSAFEAFGRRYQAALARHGITVELRATRGSLENLKALADPGAGAHFGFVQGGTVPTEGREASELRSLGSLFYEPLWIFYREASARERLGAAQVPLLTGFAGWRLAVGPPGSGGAELLQRLTDLNQMPAEAIVPRAMDPSEAVAKLLEGELDAVLLPQAPQSPLVRMLLQTPGMRFFEFSQAQAYARRLAFLSPVVLPRGVVSPGQDLPAADVALVATTSTLVAAPDAHPALVRLMVQAAADIHGGSGWFRRAGEFPNAAGGEIALADEAMRHYRDGRPLLQRYLPFWLANLIDRMWVALTLILAVVLPLSRVIPPIYRFRVRSRVFRWYAQLRRIEDDAAAADADRQALLAELDALEQRVEHIPVPLAYADELYALRANIGLVRSRLR